MRRTRLGPRGPRIALAVLLGSAILAGLSIRRAVTLELPGESESHAGLLAPEASPAPEPASLESVLAAVEIDPFHPERRRPGSRFRLPGEPAERIRAPAPRLSAPTSLVLTGTVIYPDGGGLAVLSQDRGATMTLRVGERLGELTLQKVERERAIFSGPGGRQVVIPVRRSGG